MEALLFDFVNPAVCLAIAVAISVAVVHEKVKDGVIMKLAMILAALGFYAAAYGLRPDASDHQTVATLRAAILLINLGFLLGVAGYYYRRARCKGAQRRSSDWMTLDGLAQRHTDA